MYDIVQNDAWFRYSKLCTILYRTTRGSATRIFFQAGQPLSSPCGLRGGGNTAELRRAALIDVLHRCRKLRKARHFVDFDDPVLHGDNPGFPEPAQNAVHVDEGQPSARTASQPAPLSSRFSRTIAAALTNFPAVVRSRRIASLLRRRRSQ